MIIELLPSKIGVPTLQVEVANKKVLLHSKYNPVQEAERFIESQCEKIEEAEHIILYGGGLGYFVQAFIEKYPEKLVSVYEPFSQIAQLCVKQKGMTQIQLHSIEHFLIENLQESIEQTLQPLREIVYQKFVIITPPVYERLFPEKVEQFSYAFKNFLLLTGNDISTVSEFSMRWTINAIKNFKETVSSQNVFEKKKYFKGKPVILVSAGPSLTEELDNLRTIKEQGLAYIFAVGSANKTLIKHDILPDAVCTYDPQHHNYQLFEEIYSRHIDTIPMIYATTVGYETLEFYTGPKYHFITTQDQLTQQLLTNRQEPVIYDAPSVAVMALQVLNALQVSKVILVGQNFAFKQGKFYADGIDRFDKEKNTLSDNSVQLKDEKTALEVKDVQGHLVKTNTHFLQMKSDMETVIQIMKVPVVNTTIGGARIEGAPFKSLSILVNTELNKRIVQQKWSMVEKKQKINKQAFNAIRYDSLRFIEQYELLEDAIREIKEKKDSPEITNEIEAFNDNLKQIQNSTFFQLFLASALKRMNEKLNASLKVANKKLAHREKVVSIVKAHEFYLQELLIVFKQINSIFQMNLLLPNDMRENERFYGATCGVFHYEAEWQKKWLTRQESKEGSIHEVHGIGVETKTMGATFEFCFKGTQLRLVGTNHSHEPLKLKVTIDGKEELATVNEMSNEQKYGAFIAITLFETENLSKELHKVSVEVLSKDVEFTFLAAYTEESAYHIHEVERIEDLVLGKRIRCSYNATFSELGVFSKIGVGSSEWIPIISSPKPIGDFFLIDIGNGKLVADRVIQNYIKLETLINGMYKKDKLFLDKDTKMRVQLLSGSGVNNDWNEAFTKDSIVKQLNILYRNNYVASWTVPTDLKELKEQEVKNTIMRGDFYHYGINDSFGENLLYQLETTWVLESPGVGFRPIFVINN
ncbi:hypothetical protein ABIA69_001848 [Lysinibacillus parviboronicapiens]|uniref:6-hydroxymethylpterin diphosphokinase MptE-like domain-containing protein n=1 Tax=Lysinibacillus parviboronicapiens TaxID=436516 RepID=A0ABV2PJ88_9BACI